jgi:hypothetical protein
MSTYTTSLGLEEITPGDQAGLWGNTTNNNLELIDQAVTGVTPITFAGVSGTVKILDAANGAVDEARAAVLNITGNATGSNTIVVPNKQKTYLVRNATGQTVNFRTASPAVGGTYPLEAGNSILIFCDGNNSVFTGIISPDAGTLTVSRGGTNATGFTAGFVISPGGTGTLSSQAFVEVGGTARTQILGQVSVQNGGTGLANVPTGSLLTGTGIGAMNVLAQGNNGQVLTSNGAGSPPSFRDAATGVASVSSGGNITVSPTTGSVVVSLSGANVISALGYTPVNPSTLSSYALLTGATFSGNISGTTAIFSGDLRASSCLNASGNSGVLNDGSIRIGNSSSTIFYLGGAFQMAIDGQFPFFFRSNGSAEKPGGGSWAGISDARLKDNVTPLTGALDKLLALNPVSYTWKYPNPNVSNVGFIAQEVKQIIPSAVSISVPTEAQKPFIDDNQALGIGWQNDMTAYLVGAIKELSAKVEAQATEIAALKAK